MQDAICEGKKLPKVGTLEFFQNPILPCKVELRRESPGRIAPWINDKVCSSVVQLCMVRADMNHGMHPSMNSGKIRKPRF